MYTSRTLFITNTAHIRSLNLKVPTGHLAPEVQVNELFLNNISIMLMIYYSIIIHCAC